MNIHEFQAKDILRRYGVVIPPGSMTSDPTEAEKIARDLNVGFYAVKAQIHSGGRGKAGGVKLVKTPADVAAATRELIGKKLVTNQTGPQGRVCQKVLVAAAPNIKREIYVSSSKRPPCWPPGRTRRRTRCAISRRPSTG